MYGNLPKNSRSSSAEVSSVGWVEFATVLNCLRFCYGQMIEISCILSVTFGDDPHLVCNLWVTFLESLAVVPENGGNSRPCTACLF